MFFLFFVYYDFMVFVIRITVLGLPQDAAHTASTKTPKSLVLRARTPFSPSLAYDSR